MRWPEFSTEPNASANAVGTAMETLIARSTKQAERDAQSLQAARANVAKQQRAEDLAAKEILNTSMRREK